MLSLFQRLRRPPSPNPFPLPEQGEGEFGPRNLTVSISARVRGNLARLGGGLSPSQGKNSSGGRRGKEIECFTLPHRRCVWQRA